MSEQIDHTELLGKVEDETVRNQLAQAFDALSGSSLRKQLDDVLGENKTLKTTVRNHAFRDAGFDPESGPGKALAKLYEGEPDPEKIQQVATEYGLTPNAGQGTTQPDNAEERQAGEDRTALLNQGSTAPRDPSINDQIKQLDAEGKFTEADRLRVQQLTSR